MQTISVHIDHHVDHHVELSVRGGGADNPASGIILRSGENKRGSTHKSVPYSLARLILSETRIERDGPVVIGPGSRQIAPLAPDESAIEVADCRRRIQFDGAIVIGQRAFEIALGQSRRATVAPGRGEVWL